MYYGQTEATVTEVTPEAIQEFRAKRYNGVVTHLEMLNSELMVLRVKPDFPRPKYLGGQYCTLGLANFEERVAECQSENLKPEDLLKIVKRSYSISNSIYADTSMTTLRNPDEDDWLEFYIVLVRENLEGRVPALTPRLFNLKVGDRLNIGEKITGHFTLEGLKPTDAVVFLSTGTGEAPHNSMMNELLRNGHTGPIVAICCVRLVRDLGYLAIHEQLMKQYKNYIYLPLTTREGISTGKKYIQDLIVSGDLDVKLTSLGGTLNPVTTHVYLCGNPKMIGIPYKDKETGSWKYPQPVGVIEILENMGFKADNPAIKVAGNVHFEKYW